MLTEAYEQVDMISAHAYYFEEAGDLASFLASPVDMDHFIDSVVATADAVRVVKRAPKRIGISFDEWNVWYGQNPESRPPSGDDWPVAPSLLEDRYNVADAVVVGGLLISLLRHTDRVHSASLAQLVNVIAPIMTEPGGRAWKQTTFHPFSLTSRHAAGQVLRPAFRALPTHETARFGDAPIVDAVATFDEDAGEVVIFAVNRSTTDAIDFDVDLRAFGGSRVVEAVSLSNPDHRWVATADDDFTVRPRPVASECVDGAVRARLAPVSWSMLRVSCRVEG